MVCLGALQLQKNRNIGLGNAIIPINRPIKNLENAIRSTQTIAEKFNTTICCQPVIEFMRWHVVSFLPCRSCMQWSIAAHATCKAYPSFLLYLFPFTFYFILFYVHFHSIFFYLSCKNNIYSF